MTHLITDPVKKKKFISAPYLPISLFYSRGKKSYIKTILLSGRYKEANQRRGKKTQQQIPHTACLHFWDATFEAIFYCALFLRVPFNPLRICHGLFKAFSYLTITSVNWLKHFSEWHQWVKEVTVDERLKFDCNFIFYQCWEE